MTGSENQTFDELLLTLAERHNGVSDLLTTIFSFFERKTDLFDVMETPQAVKGFPEHAAENLVLKVFREQQCIHKKRSEDAKQTNTHATDSTKPSPAISTFNGGLCDNYRWTQTISDLTMEVVLPEPVSSAQLSVSIKQDSIKILSNAQTIVQGDFSHKVTPSECLWSLESGTRLVISLEKALEQWWPSPLIGGPSIDLTKVDSTKKVEQYDESTQGAIRKILFDQSQKAQGKPTSDQLLLSEKLKDAWNAPHSPFAGTAFNPAIL